MKADCRLLYIRSLVTNYVLVLEEAIYPKRFALISKLEFRMVCFEKDTFLHSSGMMCLSVC